jgi:hypothetical protein
MTETSNLGNPPDLQSPQGHAIGFVDTQTECDAVIQDLHAAGFANSVINVFAGNDGTVKLEQMMDGFGWGETAENLLKQGKIELSRGHLAVMIELRDRDQAMLVATVSTKHGGHSFNYFGGLTDERLTA